MLLTGSGPTHPAAHTALSNRRTITLLTLDYDVFRCQFMTPWAMGPGDRDLAGAHLLHALRRGDREEASQDVDAPGHGLEVIGIDAAFDPAQMVNLQSFRDWPLGVFISQTVGRNAGAAPPGRNSAVVASQDTLPDPAAAEWDGYASIEQLIERCGKMLQGGHSLWSFTAGSRSGAPPGHHTRRCSDHGRRPAWVN